MSYIDLCILKKTRIIQPKTYKQEGILSHREEKKRRIEGLQEVRRGLVEEGRKKESLLSSRVIERNEFYWVMFVFGV